MKRLNVIIEKIPLTISYLDEIVKEISSVPSRIFYVTDQNITIEKVTTISDVNEIIDEICDESDLLYIGEEVIFLNSWIKYCYDEGNAFYNIATISPISTYLKRKLPSYTIKQEPCINVNCPESFCFYIKGNVLNQMKKYLMLENQKGKPLFSEELFSNMSKLGYEHIVSKEAVVSRKVDTNLNEITINYDTILEQLPLAGDRKCILIFTFADFEDDGKYNVGGTQFHTKDLVMRLKEKYSVVVVAREDEYIRVTQYINEEKKRYQFWVGERDNQYKLLDLKHKKVLEYVIDLFAVDIIHIHHMLWMKFDIALIAKERKIPLLYSVHDYYLYCPILKMLNLRKESCNINGNEQDCEYCLKEEVHAEPFINYIKKWRDNSRFFLASADMIFFPSYSVKSDFKNNFFLDETKCKVIYHGIDTEIYKKSSVLKSDFDFKNRKIKVAFLGGISEVKGADLIYNMINLDENEVEWYIIGGNSYMPLINLKKDNLIKISQYKREDIGRILNENKIDLVCILSIVPETFCYTLSEAISSEIPIIVTDIGALGERMRKYECGWIVPRNISPKEMLNKIIEIKSNSIEYEEKYNKTKNTSIKDNDRMAAEYEEYYDLLKIEKKKIILNIECNKNQPKENRIGKIKNTINNFFEFIKR